MSTIKNEYAQPIGSVIPDWTTRPRPQRVTLESARCRLEPLDGTRHAAELYTAYAEATDDKDWTYMAVGPFKDVESYRSHAEAAAASNDPLHFAVIDRAHGRAVGTLSLMRVDPANGVIEVGNVMFSPLLKRTAISTEAQYLLMKYVFEELGYRRYEWKCDCLNEPSRKAAIRLGFQFEGIFRQAVVYKGRNRDTAWYAMLDSEWPAVRKALETWLAAENFDEQGTQRKSLPRIRSEQWNTSQHCHQESHSSDGTPVAVTIRPLKVDDHTQWLPLWQAYQTFYEVDLDSAINDATWRRLIDPAEPMFALGAFDENHRLLGIVHYLFHASTWSTAAYCYLQDLFTLPSVRGRGIGRGLIEAVSGAAKALGSSRVYWHTHETNRTARTLYDKVAENEGFIKYTRSID